MFLLECEAHVSSHCLGKVAAATGAIDEFICIACLADKAFGGKDGVPVAAGSGRPTASPTNVPANPGSSGSLSPSTPGALLFLCPSCKQTKSFGPKYIAGMYETPPPWWVCQDCFRASRPRTEGRAGG